MELWLTYLKQSQDQMIPLTQKLIFSQKLQYKKLSIDLNFQSPGMIKMDIYFLIQNSTKINWDYRESARI